MLTQPTLEKLKGLKLEAMAAAWLEQNKNPETVKLSFDERLGLIVDAEWLFRENKRLTRCLKEAKLRLTQACIEDIDYGAKRQLDPAVLRQITTCGWVREHHNLVITGATGTEKTYMACAFAHQACRNGFRALYRRAPRFFHELTVARADGTYVRLLGRLARVDVLVIDDWGLNAPADQQCHDLLEVLEDRCGTRSTTMTSQLPTSKWHEYLGDPTVADAICDRILNTSHRLVLKGPSRRKEGADSTK